MTEDQIEAKAEAMMDGLDRRYLAGSLTEAEYRAEVRLIDDWAVRQYQSAQAI